MSDAVEIFETSDVDPVEEEDSFPFPKLRKSPHISYDMMCEKTFFLPTIYFAFCLIRDTP